MERIDKNIFPYLGNRPIAEIPPLNCWQSFAKLKFAALLTRPIGYGASVP